MKVLVACEESQAVCKAFRERGHEAYSCDIIECSGGHPEWHIIQDVVVLLNGCCSFITSDSVLHTVNTPWDLIIAFPPCTYLTASGAVRLYPKKGFLDHYRFKKGLEAADFFKTILSSNCEKICVENPLPMKIFALPKYTQIIHPFMFGHAYSKRTCLWLKGLPELNPTDIITDNIVSWVFCSRNPKIRSKTFPGVAKAMSVQWG